MILSHPISNFVSYVILLNSSSLLDISKISLKKSKNGNGRAHEGQYGDD